MSFTTCASNSSPLLSADWVDTYLELALEFSKELPRRDRILETPAETPAQLGSMTFLEVPPTIAPFSFCTVHAVYIRLSSFSPQILWVYKCEEKEEVRIVNHCSWRKATSMAEASDPRAQRRERQTRLVRELLRDLEVDAGDVILFDRKCAGMGAYGASICACAKFFGHTQWDHNGVVVRGEGGELLLLEAAISGVKMRPLVDRIVRSNSHEVAVRKLQVPRTPEFRARALQFAHLIRDSPYEDRPQRFFNAGVKVPTRIERERLFDAVVSKKKALAKLESDLEHRDKMPDFERNALGKERDRVAEQYHTLVGELSTKERSMFENEVIARPQEGGKVFCSQLVAGLYQHLGLLLPYPSTNSYLPKHFSDNDGGGYLKLQQDATYLPEISLRQRLEENHTRYRRLATEAETRSPQSGKEVNTIVRCLRRHQLFHTLSESQLVEIAKKFRRRAFADGEVVFYQGMPGDYFYIIEQGECEVYVDYDHLRKTQAPGTEESGDVVKKPVTLRKRKTIALPEFHTPSSIVGKNERVLVATNGPGNAFGESAVIYDTPRRATLRATSGSNRSAPPLTGENNAKTPTKKASPTWNQESLVVWQLDKQSFKDIVEAHPASQKSMDEHVFLMDAISDHPLFSELDDRAKALAVRKCFPLRVRAGTTILRQGDSGDYFYVIESGKCEISRKKPRANAPFVDRVIGCGASFGEAALLYNSRRGASVKAIEDTKIWCMDRASFLTITRSGSTALHQLFQKVSNTIVEGSNESFATEKDLRRMLRDPEQLIPIQHSANSPNVMEQLQRSKLPSQEGYDRAVQLALALLLNDSSGLVNFSQFAHFHIALGASNIDQLLPEAAFRILKLLESKRDSEPTSTDGEEEQSAIKLSDIPLAIRKWIATSDATPATHSHPDDKQEISPRELEFYERLFDLPSNQIGGQYVTHDDLVRAIAAISDEHESSEEGEDAFYISESEDEEIAKAKAEFRAFVAALKFDIQALRTIWRAAELHAHGSDPDTNYGQQQLTFDANLKSGWISAIRHNPTGGDWEYLKPDFEARTLLIGEAFDEINESIEKQKATGQLTSFAAAIAAGGLARTATAPLERLKILMQLPPPKTPGVSSPYASTTRGFMNMIKLGGVRGAFSGNLTHCLWVIPSLPTKFLLCDFYRHQLNQLATSKSIMADGNSVPRLPSPDLTNLVAGGLAGLTANCLFYPLDVIRGRLSTQQYLSGDRQYRGIADCARAIHREGNGLRAFYRGFLPASLGVFTYIGCNYSIYESLRPVFILYDTDTAGPNSAQQLGHPSIPGQILCATTASLTSQFLSYPFDVVRRRLQLQGSWHQSVEFPTYTSAWDCAVQSVRDDPAQRWKVRGLYRGVVVNALKALPSAVISFLSYEKLREIKDEL